METKGYEVEDINAKGVEWIAFGLVLGAVVLFFGLAWAFFFEKERLEKTLPATASASLLEKRSGPLPPLLQQDPSADLKIYQREQKKLLGSYGWIDRKSERVRIPIARAMEMIAP